MPVTFPAGTEIELAKIGGFLPYTLLDVQTGDGSTYFLSDVDGVFPSKITSVNQQYSAWVKAAGEFAQSKDFSTDAGDITLQNLSGNSIDRDVASAIKNHEFEGAIAVIRLWHPLLQLALKEFHFTLSEQSLTEEDASFRLLSLLDYSRLMVADDVITELCAWDFKSKQCGSTGTATGCLKRFKEDCQDPTRAAQERFTAVLVTIQSVAVFNSVSGGGGDAGAIRGGRGGLLTNFNKQFAPLRN